MFSRIFRLSESESETKTLRVLSAQATLPQSGKGTSWVTVTRTGSFTDPRYGRFEITPTMLSSMVANFEAGIVGQDVFLDVNHKPGDGSAAKILKLSVEGNRLRALVEWTDFGVKAVKERGFTYLSAEFADNWQDNEAGAFHGPTLLGAGLTVRPVIKRLDPITLSCESGGDVETRVLAELADDLLKKAKQTMNKWQDFLKKLADAGYSAEVQAGIKKLGEALLDIPFSTWTIVLGHATFCIVVVYNNAVARFRRTSGALIDAAMDLGADGLQTFRLVILPNIGTALLAGGMLAFALSFDEVIVTTFTAGNQSTLPIWMLEELVRPRQRPVTNVVAMAVVLVTVLPILAAYYLTKDGEDTAGSEK